MQKEEQNQKNDTLANPSEVTESGKNYQMVLKALKEWITGK